MNFFARVYEVVKKIPKGKVASYGLVAAVCGSPRAARQVGWALHQLDQNPGLMATIPWHRVINSRGFISTTCHTHTADMQKQLLEMEGIEVTRKEKMWWIDLKEFSWKI